MLVTVLTMTADMIGNDKVRGLVPRLSQNQHLMVLKLRCTESHASLPIKSSHPRGVN